MTAISQAYTDRRLQYTADVLRAIAHPVRIQMVNLIGEHEGMTVQELTDALELEQSITSQHLRILRQVQLVSTRRDGKFIEYSLVKSRIDRLSSAVMRFLAEDKATATA